MKSKRKIEWNKKKTEPKFFLTTNKIQKITEHIKTRISLQKNTTQKVEYEDIKKGFTKITTREGINEKKKK